MGRSETFLKKAMDSKPHVCRRLNFDDEDADNNDGPMETPGGDDNIHNLFYEEMMRSLEEAKKRWNYDFVNDRPLKGDYEWVRCDGDNLAEPEVTPSEEGQPLAEEARGEEVVEHQQPEVREEDDDERDNQ